MNRRYDIDAIRVFAFILLIFYHVGMFFSPWAWHIKNDILYPELKYPMLFLNQWRLPLLFVVSGMGTYFALAKRTAGQYTKERAKRLLLPLFVGILFIIPPQVYIERINQGISYGGYFHYWPSESFKGVYPEGNFSWHHLWFIFYLFVFSLLLLPVFLYIKNNAAGWLNRKLKILFTSVSGLIAMALPLLLCRMLLSGAFPPNNAFLGDWFQLFYYALFFLLGFLVINAGELFWKTAERYRFLFFAIGAVTFSILMYLWFGGFRKTPVFDLLNDSIQSLNVWIWILAITGLFSFYLNKPGKILLYANEAVYPFYILHQTVIVILGYYIRNREVGFFIKFPVMVFLTFLITWVIYEFGIRRYKLIRPLFGLKNS